MSTMSVPFHTEPSPSAAVAGPSMLLNAPVAPSWDPWMMRLERLVYKACQNTRRQERRARRVVVTLVLDDGAVVRRALALPRPTDKAGDVLPAALGLLRLLLGEHEGRVRRLAVSLNQLVEGADQPIRFERYLARRKQQRLVKLASLFACFSALGGLFTVR